MSTEVRLSNIDYIRCFAILGIVLYHSICVYVSMSWRSGLPGIDQGLANSLFPVIYSWMEILLMPDANMPLFVAISAYVYSFLWHRGRYNNTKQFLVKKIKRLMIPYFVIGTIVLLTIVDGNLKDIIWGKAHHLWFCAALFWCFIYIRLYHVLPPILKVFFIIFCIPFLFYGAPYNFLGITKGIKYFPYFLLGFYLYPTLPKIKSRNYSKYFAVLFWMLTIAAYKVLEINYLEVLVCFAYCFMIFLIVPETINPTKWVTSVSYLSFGIYVFHEWFLWNMAHINYLHPFIIEHQLLYPLFAFVLVLSMSIVLTKICLKTKVGRFLLAS